MAIIDGHSDEHEEHYIEAQNFDSKTNPNIQNIALDPIHEHVNSLLSQFSSPEFITKLTKKARGPHNRENIPKVVNSISVGLEKLLHSEKDNIESDLKEFEMIVKSQMKNFVKVKGKYPKYLQDFIEMPIIALIEKIRESFIPHSVVPAHQEQVAEEVSEVLVEIDYEVELGEVEEEILKFDFHEAQDLEKLEDLSEKLSFLIRVIENSGQTPVDVINHFKMRFKSGVTEYIRSQYQSSYLLILQRDLLRHILQFGKENLYFLSDGRKNLEAEILHTPNKNLSRNEAHNEMIQKNVFKEGRGWFEAVNEVEKEFDLFNERGVNSNHDLLFEAGIAYYAKERFDLNLDSNALKEIWLLLFRECAKEQGWKKIVSKKGNRPLQPYQILKTTADSVARMGILAGLLTTAFASKDHDNYVGNLSESKILVADVLPVDQVDAQVSQINAGDKDLEMKDVAAEMPVWDYVKKLDAKVSMSKILSDPRVSEYLDANSTVKFDSRIAFSSIKSELLEDGGFKGAFEMAPDAKTINEYLKVIAQKDSGLALRMKAEFQMFGLKKPAELNAIIKKVVEDSDS